MDKTSRDSICKSCENHDSFGLKKDSFGLKKGSFGLKKESIGFYVRDEINQTVKNSLMLNDNRLPCVLLRFQDIVEFCKLQDYSNAELIHCCGLESLAQEIRELLKKEGINTLPTDCTINGLKEPEMYSEKSGEMTFCNSAGQAHLHNERTGIVIELGLCIGNDVHFYHELTVPFTVMLLKDTMR